MSPEAENIKDFLFWAEKAYREGARLARPSMDYSSDAYIPMDESEVDRMLDQWEEVKKQSDAEAASPGAHPPLLP